MLRRKSLCTALVLAVGSMSVVASAKEATPAKRAKPRIRVRITAPPSDEKRAAKSPEAGKATESASTGTRKAKIEAPFLDLEDNVDVVVLGLGNLRIDCGSPFSVVQFNVLKFPFMRIAALESVTSKPPDEPAPAFDENPFATIFPFDEPLVSLIDLTALLPEKDEQEAERAWRERIPVRLRILDSVVFCLFQRDAWNDKQFCEEWLEMPLVTTFKREKTKKRSALHILNVPFANVVRHVDKGHEGDTRILDAPGVSIFNRQRGPEEEDTWVFIKALMFDLLHREKCREKKEFNAVSLSILDLEINKRPIDLNFSLFRRERRENGEDRTEYLHLPLVGPLFAKWKGPNTEHPGSIIPRLLHWSDFPY